MEFKELEEKDYNKVIYYAASGMSFSEFNDDPEKQRKACKIEFYDALMRATETLAAYEDGEFAGVMVLGVNGKPKLKVGLGKKIMVKFFKWLEKVAHNKEDDSYDEINTELLAKYKKENDYDGEIIFFVANPDLKIKGIGTQILNELERRYDGKTFFLFSDSGCTHQFYEHRGFTKYAEKINRFTVSGEKRSIINYLYVKTLGEKNDSSN